MSHRRIESFLLRIVVEDHQTLDPDAWRGRIQHVGSGCERQFEHLLDIVTFICDHLTPEQGRAWIPDEQAGAG